MIYCAGWNLPERELAILSTKDWYRSFDINIHAAFASTQAVLPGMRERGAGTIVFISSISATHPDGSGASYQSSKRALHGLAEAINYEEGRTGRCCRRRRIYLRFASTCNDSRTDNGPDNQSLESVIK